VNNLIEYSEYSRLRLDQRAGLDPVVEVVLLDQPEPHVLHHRVDVGEAVLGAVLKPAQNRFKHLLLRALDVVVLDHLQETVQGELEELGTLADGVKVLDDYVPRLQF